MGLISREQADGVLDKLISIDVYSAARWNSVVEAVMSCVTTEDEPSNLDKLNYSYFHERIEKVERNIFTLESNHYKLQTGSDNDFSIVHQRIDKALKHNDQLDHWLHALEKAIMDIKGMMLGRMAAQTYKPDGHNGYLTKEKPQGEEIAEATAYGGERARDKAIINKLAEMTKDK